MRRIVVVLLATALFVIWPLASARGSQPAGSAKPTVRDDFNGDSFPDLAIGVPDERLGGAEAAGVVHVLYGSPAGLTATGSQLWSQDSPGVAGVPEAVDRFGTALASGDYNGDGSADLALGAPGENTFAGVVHVLYGSPAGLTASGSQLWSQDSPGVAGVAEEGDQFSFALAAGDLNGDLRGELAVGAPGENGSAGVVHVLYGSPAGLTATGSQLWSQDSPGVAGGAEPDDRFGNALTAGDFNADGRADLAVGAWAENSFSGVVHVLYGSPAGLTATGSQLWSQDSPGVIGAPEGADFFGQALAAGDFNGDTQAELAVGTPGENVSTGVVHVLIGSPAGLTATGSQLWSQDSPGVAGAAEQGDRFGDALAAGTLTSQGNAAASSRVPSSRTTHLTGR